ncbi:OmpP1/FadL family transporter [Oceaniserpentilla sp. 4NH20-0058]|uniref:outer membrane protein transport protein n=1 Tax=Oceaniserpentilla sp. 4NH20-0058 TaxID=3127660 RepID=UPI0031061D5E
MNFFFFKISTLSAAIIAATPAMAGGFDNSNRSFDIIYGDNNIITTQFGQTFLPMKANVNKMKRAQTSNAEANSKRVKSGDIVGNLTRPQVGFRYKLLNDISCAGQIEQPFATQISFADDQYTYVKTDVSGNPVDINGHPTYDPSSMDTAVAPINSKYESESFTMACGYTMALPKGQVKIFAGPKIQSVKGSFNQDLTPSPSAIGEADNLTVVLDGGTELGYVAGIAYEIPKIALRASFLYHSQVDYDAKGTITAKIPNVISFNTRGTAKTFTPQTLELALVSGIAEDTLGFVKLRWSEYSKLTALHVIGDDAKTIDGNRATIAQANQFSGNRLDPLINPKLDMFSNDTFDYSIGIGHRVSDQLSVVTTFTSSTKIGDSTRSHLLDGSSYTLGFGGEYSLIKNLKLNGGLGFTLIDGYTVELPSGDFRAEFSQTEAISFQLGLSYEI